MTTFLLILKPLASVGTDRAKSIKLYLPSRVIDVGGGTRDAWRGGPDVHVAQVCHTSLLL